jgi:hypothetical protein
MAVFLGATGNIRLKRGSQAGLSTFEDQITPDDVTVSLNRVGLSRSGDNLVTGDRVEIATTDPRGLVCFASSNWGSAVVEDTITAYVNVNAVGGLRLFDTFNEAVNNNRSAEYTVTAFAGAPLPVIITLRDSVSRVLGNVTSYELNTTRDQVDTTSLSDKFKTQFAAGLISGSGRIDCLFDYKSTGIKEVPLMLLQTLQRVDIGSTCDLALYVVDQALDATETSVYYEFEAVITASGISVDTDTAITCTLDFVTTGEIKLLVGEPVGYILKEDEDRIYLERSLGFLLQESED